MGRLMDFNDFKTLVVLCAIVASGVALILCMDPL